MMKYLVTYACDREYCSELVTIGGLADLIGFADCSDYYDFRVYNLWTGQPEELRYEKECSPGYCAVTLYNHLGKEIDSAEYAEH